MQTNITEGFRLSPQQEHLWQIQQFNKNFPYRVQTAVLIEGNLDTHAFKVALENVAARYEIIRTNFHCLPGMTLPVQIINDSNIIWKQELDLSNLNLQEQEAKIATLFEEVSRLPFDFEKDQLLHTSLIKLSPCKHILLLSLPAMCADSTTMKNLLQELSRTYAACLENEQLSDEPLQYADIAAWQHELLETEETEIGKQHWCKQNILPWLDLTLPFENQLAESSEFQPEFVKFTIESNWLAHLENLVQQHNVEISAFFLACWQILIWRFTGQTDIVIATGSTGRKYAELESALGLFAKYLPVQLHLEETSSFIDILQQVNISLCEANKWEECFTWEQVIGSEENSINLPFCPFGFNFETGSSRYESGEISLSIYQHYACIERFKVKLDCLYVADVINAELHYDASLFCHEDIASFAEHFQNLLPSAIANPKAAISELEILSDRQREQLLIEFNNTQTNYFQAQSIIQLFQEQVRRTPNNFTVAFDHQKLTYSELNERANQLAHYLQQLGIKPDDLVGLCVERSSETLPEASLYTIVGILGILKAGGAYVPLDPAYPSERLAFIFADSQVTVLLTQQHLVQKLPEHQAKTICLDTEWQTIAQQSQENPQAKITSENLAYVIYTSGSTGKPKGVQITHGNLVHSTIARITYYQEPVTSFLLLSSFAFDSSVAGIFWTLCCGGMLCLPQEGGEKDLLYLIELINQNNISHLLSLPSLYALLLEQAKPEQLVSLHTVIVAGEACTKQLVELHLQQLPETSLFNEYGPTEATVWSSVYHCTSKLTTPVPIGRAIANTQIYLLDSHLQPVPISVAGEVYISGEGLARGYLNHPDLTTERFIPNPFSNQPGSRLYKTGDLARYLADGNIEFKGRIDQQVKIRGYRIELGEVEAVLSQHPQVRSLAVIARVDEAGHKRLVAYIVPEEGHSPSTSDFRRFLTTRLPEYMVPSAFIKIKTLPFLPNGKVDIKALPAPETLRDDLSGGFVAPQTPVEKILAEIWTQVLRIEQVGIHDNFFELGGDSIISIQIVARANQMGLQLTPRQLFAHQTIAKLSQVTTTTQNIDVATGEIPFTPTQQELNYWFADSRKQVQPLPVDFYEAERQVENLTTISVFLSSIETQALLQEVPKAYQTQTDDVLLTALVQAFEQWTGESKLLVDLQYEGQEKIFDDLNVSPTVRYFTSAFPVLLDVREASDAGERLKAIKEQLRLIPNKGIGYGLLRYLSGESTIVEQLQALPSAKVKFYHQVLSQSSLLTMANLSIEESHSYLLDISWSIVDNQLQMNWTYSKDIYRQNTVERLIETFMEALRSLLAHCQSSETNYTPSDFPQANLSQKDLDRFLATINRKSKKTSN
jgi:amino acid adenylation domain-containing protein/non-ribosomal peptide synthase protein (TIGR01720 family)